MINSFITPEFFRNCIPRALDVNKVKGNIVLCEHRDGIYTVKQKLRRIKRLGALGMILVSNNARGVATSSGSFPMATVDRNAGSKIISYAKTKR